MTIKIRIGEYLYPIEVNKEGNRLYLSFQYNKDLIIEVKSMKGAKWHAFDKENPRKIWSIEDCARNQFQLDYLSGKNPYAPYDIPLVKLEPQPRFNHEKQQLITPRAYQLELAAHAITRRKAIIAGETGTGKTLALILAMEWARDVLGFTDSNFWYVANKSGVRSFSRELEIWGCKIKPAKMLTYEALVKVIENWREGDPAPKFITFDESQKVKNPTAKRSLAAEYISECIRSEHKEVGFVIEMSGSPAPKSPADWWMQAEIACPGYLKEGTYPKFKQRLAVIVEKENLITGGTFPQLVTWLDNKAKCSICGELKNHPNHDSMSELIGGGKFHDWVESKNEIEYLYQRMKGLVLVKFKKQCTDLPDKQYKVITVTPSSDVLRAAQLLADSSPTAIEALTLLRELSDGFQYKDKITGKETCKLCQGKKVKIQATEVPKSCPNCDGGECFNHTPAYTEAESACDGCNGTGEIAKYERIVVEVPCPKEDIFKELLDDHEEIGRMVTFAGFTGSIDRLVRVATESGWDVIRVDGRGWMYVTAKGELLNLDPLKAFQEGDGKIVFIAHPESGGTSVTLTRSPTIFYYSNDFKAENRIQSEDRIHRLGMDVNKGATIVDVIHLPSDEKIMKNLKAKRDLQSMSLGEIQGAMNDSVSVSR